MSTSTFESDRYLEDGDRHSFGIVFRDLNQTWTYRPLGAEWCGRKRPPRRPDRLAVRPATAPDMHIYHFSPYEPARRSSA
ncbi:MAG: hypothetical protein R2806_20420 [Saprospiraceae bacterium]